MRCKRYVVPLTLGLLSMVFGLSTAAGASAASFKYSSTGSLDGSALSSQSFTVNSGRFTCSQETLGGTAEALTTEVQAVTVDYSGCSYFGFANVAVTPGEYDLHADGRIDVVKPVTFNIGGMCTLSIRPKSGLEQVGYENQSGRLSMKFAIAGFSYTSSGGLCGSSGSNGTLVGRSSLELAGGSVEFEG